MVEWWTFTNFLVFLFTIILQTILLLNFKNAAHFLCNFSLLLFIITYFTWKLQFWRFKRTSIYSPNIKTYKRLHLLAFSNFKQGISIQTYRNNIICYKVNYFLGQTYNSQVKNSRILWIRNAKFKSKWTQTCREILKSASVHFWRR